MQEQVLSAFSFSTSDPLRVFIVISRVFKTLEVAKLRAPNESSHLASLLML